MIIIGLMKLGVFMEVIQLNLNINIAILKKYWIFKMKKYSYEYWLVKIREAEETLPENRTKQQQQLLINFRNAPSWNNLFGKSKK